MDRHRFDALSFVFGLLFLGMALLAPVRDWFPGNTIRWIVPGAVLLLGAGLAISAVAADRAASRPANQPVEHSQE
jgi:hypothetical protein